MHINGHISRRALLATTGAGIIAAAAGCGSSDDSAGGSGSGGKTVENHGRVALMRGPLLYCVEQADNPDVELRDITFPAGASPHAHPPRLQREPELLGGVVAMDFPVTVRPVDAGWTHALYRESPAPTWLPEPATRTVRAVPYYAWANRDPGAMQVWLRTAAD